MASPLIDLVGNARKVAAGDELTKHEFEEFL